MVKWQILIRIQGVIRGLNQYLLIRQNHPLTFQHLTEFTVSICGHYPEGSTGTGPIWPTAKPGGRSTPRDFPAHHSEFWLTTTRPVLRAKRHNKQGAWYRWPSLFKDLMEYKQAMDRKRLKALDELAAQAQEQGMGC
jgi:hypothetical protein